MNHHASRGSPWLLAAGWCGLVLLLAPPPAKAQDRAGDDVPAPAAGPTAAEEGPPTEPPVVMRRNLENFLTDEIALMPFPLIGGAHAPLESTFAIDSPCGSWRAIWDPTACRLVGVLSLRPPPGEPAAAESDAASPEDGQTESDESDESDESGATPEDTPAHPFRLLAAGVPPLSATPAAFETGRYFGCRFVDSAPEFLYTQGSVAIEQRLWFDANGNLRQRWRIRHVTGPVSLQFPPHWRARAEASTGTWQESTLTIPADDEGEVTVELTYSLAEST